MEEESFLGLHVNRYSCYYILIVVVVVLEGCKLVNPLTKASHCKAYSTDCLLSSGSDLFRRREELPCWGEALEISGLNLLLAFWNEMLSTSELLKSKWGVQEVECNVLCCQFSVWRGCPAEVLLMMLDTGFNPSHCLIKRIPEFSWTVP